MEKVILSDIPVHVMKAEDIAASLMQQILYDNGAVDRFHPEKYDLESHKRITKAVKFFTVSNPEFIWTETAIDHIAAGEQGETERMYGNLIGWEDLNEQLNYFFENML